MSCNIYFPDDLLRQVHDEKHVIGHKDEHGNYVVISMVPRISSLSPHGKYDVMEIDKIKLCIIGTVNFEQEGLLHFKIESGLPTVRCGLYSFVTFIVFKSPNSLHMEFYSLNSVLIKELSPNKFNDKLECHLNDQLELSERDKRFTDMLFVVNSIDFLRYKLSHLTQKETVSNTTQVRKLINPVVGLFIYMCQISSYVLNFQFFPGTTLTKLSSLFYQLDIRLSLLMRIPDQISKVKQKTASLQMKPSLPNYKASLEYIKFYNLIYIIVIDLILGNILRNLVYDNWSKLTSCLYIFTFKYLYSDLNILVKWLMDNPAGFKLNSELSNFIGELYLWAIKFWYQQVMDKLQFLNLGFIFKLVLQMSKLFGATIILSSICDIISFLLIHINCFCLSMTRIYNWQLNVSRSLFRLFYGKKYNVLRQRIDSQTYDFDQLLLGIIIFTVLVYLLPTIVAFYLSFVVLKLGFYLASIYLQMTILFLNELPVFIILLSLKNPKRLSDGLSLDLISKDESQIVIRMNSKSLSLFKLSDYYWKLVNLKVEIFSFRTILFSVLNGESIRNLNYKQIYENFENI